MKFVSDKNSIRLKSFIKENLHLNNSFTILHESSLNALIQRTVIMQLTIENNKALELYVKKGGAGASCLVDSSSSN